MGHRIELEERNQWKKKEVNEHSQIQQVESKVGKEVWEAITSVETLSVLRSLLIVLCVFA